MVEYTHDDFIILNEMACRDPDTLYDPEITWKYHTNHGFIEKHGLRNLKIFDSEQNMRNLSIQQIVDRFTRFLFSRHPLSKYTHEHLKERFEYVFLKAPLEEMPLYINESRNNLKVIAKWRLTIGK